MKNKKYLIPLLIFLFFLLMSFALPVTLVGDDKTYFNYLYEAHGNIVQFLIHRYNTWDPRTISDLLAIFFTHNIILWRIANTLALSVITIFPVLFFNQKQKQKENILFASSFVFVISMPLFWWFETGFIVTSTTYMFPLAAALLTIFPVVRIINAQKNHWFIWLFSILMFPLAVNMELVAVSLVAFNIGCIIYFILKKFKIRFPLTYLLFSIAGVLYLVMAPGEHVRQSKGNQGFFSELHFFDKIQIAFSSTGRSVFLSGTLGFLIFLIVVSSLLIYKKRSVFKIAISVIPLVVGIFVSGILSMAINDYYTAQLDETNNYVSTMKDLFLKVFTIKGTPSLIVNFGIGILFLCLFISIINFFDNKKESIPVLAIIVMGMATKAIMAFSPTVWASGQRTNIFLYFSFVVGILWLIHQVLSEHRTERQI